MNPYLASIFILIGTVALGAVLAAGFLVRKVRRWQREDEELEAMLDAKRQANAERWRGGQ